MDGFFEKYGRVIIVAVAICFVLLYLTPMRNVVGSSINGFARNFANKVGESLGTVKMPDGSESDNVAWEAPDGIEAGKQIRIDNKRYYIVKQTGNNKFLIVQDAGEFKYTDCLSYNAQKIDSDDYNVYENSYVDNYLENTYYPSLSEQLRNAIELAEIKQVSYNAGGDNSSGLIMHSDNPDFEIKYDTNFKGQKYNTLKRHVYLPSVEDMASLGKYAKGMYVTRDSVHTNPSFYWISGLNAYDGFITDSDSNSGFSSIPNHVNKFTYPSFIVDLSKVDYELVK